MTMTLIQSHNFDKSSKTCPFGEIKALRDSVLDHSSNWYVVSASRLPKTTTWMTVAHHEFDRGGLSDEIVVMALAQVMGVDNRMLSLGTR